MRARKVVNRVYRGVTYYRWILSISPKDIQQLGWVDGQTLRAYVRGSTLWIEPASAAGPGRRGVASANLEGSIRRRSLVSPNAPRAPPSRGD
ncbi:MAG TPA: hypothetical protein VMH90_03960 [Thermoplasmata archaeon]|nr:hypothetical protein [Thermoplasmata archaeon]